MADVSYPTDSLAQRLFAEGPCFDFFQAVRLIQRLAPDAKPVGLSHRPDEEAIRFRSLVSLSFPPSSIHEIGREADLPMPSMTVAFLGMAGVNGPLPLHYTEQMLRLRRDTKGPERYALRDWLDLFNHRLISLFFRAWEKYRFPIPFERGEYGWRDPDAFTRCVYSLIGVGLKPLQERLRVPDPARPDKPLGQIDDLALMRYAGFFAHRPRNAVSLERMLGDFLKLAVKVVQFQGHWLRLDPSNQSAIAPGLGNNALGQSVLVGDRLWDIQSRIRIRIGPLDYETFQEFLPDPRPIPERKKIFLLGQLIRLYAGPELDIEIQLILKKDDVPGCEVGKRVGMGTRLGWNTWSKRKPLPKDSEDAVFLVRGEA